MTTYAGWLPVVVSCTLIVLSQCQPDLANRVVVAFIAGGVVGGWLVPAVVKLGAALAIRRAR